MLYRPGDSYHALFTTQRSDTGAAADADATPSATATCNGADDSGFTLTVTNLATGRYKVAGTIPSGYAAGDVVQISVTATVNSVSGVAVIDSFIVDDKRLADLADFDPTSTGVNVVSWAGAAVSLGAASELPAVDAQALSDSSAAAAAVAANIDYLDAAVSSRSTFDATGDEVLVGSLTAGALGQFLVTNTGYTIGDGEAFPQSVMRLLLDNTAAPGQDWNADERAQIRHRLGLDGTQDTPDARGTLADVLTILQAGTRK